jgi:hypothetical protein
MINPLTCLELSLTLSELSDIAPTANLTAKLSGAALVIDAMAEDLAQCRESTPRRQRCA